MYLYGFPEMSSSKIPENDMGRWEKKSSTKWWTSVEPCLLPENVQQVALQELRENESARGQSLVAFQEWVSKNADVQNVNTGMNIAIQ